MAKKLKFAVFVTVLSGIVAIMTGRAIAQGRSTLQDEFSALMSYNDESAPRHEAMLVQSYTDNRIATGLFEESRIPPELQVGGGLSDGENSASASSSAPSEGGTDSESGGDLSSQILDPTKPLYQLQFQYTFGSSLFGSNATVNSFQFQPVIPHKSFGMNQILRSTLSYQWRGPGDEGLQPAQLFNLFVVPGAGGTFGFGPLVNFSQSTGPDSDTFQMGPAGGWVRQTGKLTYGLFNQNLFSESVGLSQLQPVLGYAFNKKWSASTGNMQITYDWQRDDWVQLPLGVQINRIVTLGKTPVRLFYNPQYNFRDLPGNIRWQHVFGVSLLSQ